MGENDLQQVQQLFDEALITSPEDRAAFLATACNDATVRAKVESLLAHHEQADDAFMRVPKPDPRFSLRGITDGPDPRIGTTIGGYHIESVIASGGMGTVYLARQKQPDRHVAMKVMHTGIHSRSALRRFQYESQILARLRHPGIAQVYEAGTHSDADSSAQTVPYFVMEYIPDARTITEYANEQNLTARERLALFIQVCDAVHHGHQKGIIHRDLKPGNILVTNDQIHDRDQSCDYDQSRDREGAVGTQMCGPTKIERRPLANARGSDPESRALVKVIDFGIARSTDSDVAVTTMKTDVGQLIGTMQYMSPEQCAADPDDLDTRSDVYALGVVLYELLCGALPYDVSGTTIMGAARMICDAPPTPPGTITGRGTSVSPVKRDVEMIVLKALKKNREERYESAAALAADMRRYLRGEPTEARPPTVWTRVLRWVARRPIAATTSACVSVALGLIVATYVSVWYLNIRPYKVKLLEGGHEARLVALNGTPLHTWTTEAPGRILFAALVEQPVEFGGGWLSLVGFEQAHKTLYPNSLCAFDVNSPWWKPLQAANYDRPVWEKQIEANDLPPTVFEAGLSEQSFGVGLCRVADIFPDRTGDEIVAVYRCFYSFRAIRVYDLQGNVLYQVWHKGTLNACYWMSGAGLLVFIGDNTEAGWQTRGVRNVGERPFPIVVFAVRPVLGLREQAYLHSEPGDSTLSPEWYKCIGPRPAMDRATFSIGPPLLKDPSRHTRLSLVFEFEGQLPAGIGWDLDESGNMVTGTQVEGDYYAINRHKYSEGDPKRFPDPNGFYLCDMSELPPPRPTIVSSPSSQKAPPVESAKP